jgi:hypothetical protein
MAIALPIVTLILGVFLGAWYTLFLTRPKLATDAIGGMGGPGPGLNYAMIQNRPGLLGIRLRRTMIFGKPIHGNIEKGLTIDRRPAVGCSAGIVDKTSGQFVAQLWWQPENPGEPWRTAVTIESGESRNLMLFARTSEERTRYFIFEPADIEASDSPPKIPREEAKLTDSRNFRVEVSYSYERQRLKFSAGVRKEFDGSLTAWSEAGSTNF